MVGVHVSMTEGNPHLHIYGPAFGRFEPLAGLALVYKIWDQVQGSVEFPHVCLQILGGNLIGK